MLPISVCVGAIRATTLPFLIDSIVGQTYRQWELVIVTQGDDPRLQDEVARLAHCDTRIRVLNIPCFGRSRALNAAMNAASTDVFAFTDDDCEAEPDWLEAIAWCFDHEPGVGIVGGEMIAPPAPRLSVSTCPSVHAMEFIYRPSECGYTAPYGFYMAGGNVAARRSVIERVGPFDEYLGAGTDFPACEDVDYGLRSEELDVWMMSTARIRVRHTFGRRSGLRQVMRLHRDYALGQGALLGKLQLWQHRLTRVWGVPVSRGHRIRVATRNPRRYLREAYKGRYVRQGKERYLARFELAGNRLSLPRQKGDQ